MHTSNRLREPGSGEDSQRAASPITEPRRPRLTEAGSESLLYPQAKHVNGGTNMAVRLVVTINAAPGKGTELAKVFRERCLDVMKEPGCEEFEVFQSVLNPDKLALLELWKD